MLDAKASLLLRWSADVFIELKPFTASLLQPAINTTNNIAEIGRNFLKFIGFFIL
jgi:hypothetical protein